MTVKREKTYTSKFVECPVNGDCHPELIALEVYQTIDRHGKTRNNAYCAICQSRMHISDRWDPSKSTHTIVWAETRGLHPIGITPERRMEMLKALGLKPKQAANPPRKLSGRLKPEGL